MGQTISLNGHRSLLEYGSGNSTIYFLKEAIKGALPLREIVSVDCSYEFFWRMYEIIIADLKPIKVAINPLPGRKLDLKRLPLLESWFILLHSYVNEYFEACRIPLAKPNLLAAIFNIKAFKRRVKLIGKYLRMFAVREKRASKLAGEALVGQDNNAEVIFDFQNGIRLRYILAPVPMKHYINDGTYNRFFAYVESAGKSKYDVVVIDGRARVSCLKKVLLDNNLSANGVVFHHDAFIETDWEGFNLLDPDQRLFLDGTNLKLDGTVFRDKQSLVQNNFVLNKIDADHQVRDCVVNEMMIYLSAKNLKLPKTSGG
jgi:hypothetical protein